MSSNLLDKLFDERMEQIYGERIAAGIAQGIAQGRAEGRAEGERSLVRRYLVERFGMIPPALEARIADADAEALAALFERALHATGIDTLI